MRERWGRGGEEGKGKGERRRETKRRDGGFMKRRRGDMTKSNLRKDVLIIRRHLESLPTNNTNPLFPSNKKKL